MTECSVIHQTFSIERTYPATPARVFDAFATKEAKEAWADSSDAAPTAEAAAHTEFDFRPGGRERFGFEYDDKIYRYDAIYYDIVPDQRIVYSYEMYADGARISVSVATIEFAKSGDGTALTWTEQGAYLDGIDSPDPAGLRKGGTEEMLEGLLSYLEAPAVG